MASWRLGRGGAPSPPVPGGKTRLSKTQQSPCDGGSAQGTPFCPPPPPFGRTGAPEVLLRQHQPGHAPTTHSWVTPLRISRTFYLEDSGLPH